MRLFVAVWPSPEAVGQLETTVDAVRPLVPGPRWVAASQWHLTLVFLGEVTVGRPEELAHRLARAASRHAPLQLSFEQAGRFDGRILFSRVAGDREPLRRLAASVTAAARRAGLSVEDRPYRPHLTLARSTTGTDLRPLVRALESFHGVDWTAREIHLMHSRPPRSAGQPPAYETVDTWPLTGPPRSPSSS